MGLALSDLKLPYTPKRGIIVQHRGNTRSASRPTSRRRLPGRRRSNSMTKAHPLAVWSLFKPNPAAALTLGMKSRPTKITGREILSYVPDLTNKDEFEKILIFELAQDTGNRRRYADSLWWLVVFWLAGLLYFLGWTAFYMLVR